MWTEFWWISAELWFELRKKNWNNIQVKAIIKIKKASFACISSGRDRMTRLKGIEAVNKQTKIKKEATRREEPWMRTKECWGCRPRPWPLAPFRSSLSANPGRVPARLGNKRQVQITTSQSIHLRKKFTEKTSLFGFQKLFQRIINFLYCSRFGNGTFSIVSHSHSVPAA